MNTNKNETKSKVKIFYIVIPQHYACRLSINHIHDEIIPYSYSIIPGAHSLFRQHGMKYTEGAKKQENQIMIHKAWWRHQMETFSALLAICAGNSPVTGEFPAQRPVTWSFMFSFICDWINGWVNNREAGDLRRNCAHYDVNVMMQ